MAGGGRRVVDAAAVGGGVGQRFQWAKSKGGRQCCRRQRAHARTSRSIGTPGGALGTREGGGGGGGLESAASNTVSSDVSKKRPRRPKGRGRRCGGRAGRDVGRWAPAPRRRPGHGQKTGLSRVVGAWGRDWWRRASGCRLCRRERGIKFDAREAAVAAAAAGAAWRGCGCVWVEPLREQRLSSTSWRLGPAGGCWNMGS